MSAESVLCVKHGSQIYMFAELHPYPSRVIVHFLKKNEEEQKIIARNLLGRRRRVTAGKAGRRVAYLNGSLIPAAT